MKSKTSWSQNQPAVRVCTASTGARLEDDDVAAVLEGGDGGVLGPPLVGDDGGPARGLEAGGQAGPLGRVGVPADGLDRVGLEEALEQPDGVAVGEQAVDVVDDDGLVAVFVQQSEEAEGGRLRPHPDGAVSDDRAGPTRLLDNPADPMIRSRLRCPLANART